MPSLTGFLNFYLFYETISAFVLTARLYNADNEMKISTVNNCRSLNIWEVFMFPKDAKCYTKIRNRIGLDSLIQNP